MKMPTLFIPHGAGPCFFMPWTHGPADMWQAMGNWLGSLAETLPMQPAAVLLVSAHWEATDFMLTASARPQLLYDYHGFPEHTYHLTYPVAGAPRLAQRARALLQDAGFCADLDDERGLDHGAFIPFKLIYPQANVPMVQLSLRADLNPEAHLRAGQALASLREAGVLIVGSGMSFHNMRPSGPDIAGRAQAFDDALLDMLMQPPALRWNSLANWTDAAHAHFAHPREEHLLPLMVACGAAGQDPARRIYAERLAGEVMVSAYRFG